MAKTPKPLTIAKHQRVHCNRAALYARMSTDHQHYSIDSQVDALLAYASAHGLSVVQRFIDAARSGVSIERRDALQRLLEVVITGRADFTSILVYDVSRWGRFQDADEAAHYEFICRKAGVHVHYCAEQFGSDETLPNTVFKGLKRAMAAEFSRELSTKVSVAMKRHTALGYFHGGFAPYGTRRMLIDEAGNPRMILRRGEAKNLQGERVVLVPGPQEEIDTVRRIFMFFVKERIPRSHIAAQLNREGTLNAFGNQWSHNNVLRILRDEIYVGRQVYNKRSRKLGARSQANPRSEWVKKENLFAPLVDPEVFASAQRILNNPWFYSDNELLDYLTATLCAHGKVTAAILKRAPGPSVTTYFERFGRLSHTLRLIGYYGVRSKTYSGDPRFIPKPTVRARLRKSSPWKHVAYRYRTSSI